MTLTSCAPSCLTTEVQALPSIAPIAWISHSSLPSRKKASSPAGSGTVSVFGTPSTVAGRVAEAEKLQVTSSGTSGFCLKPVPIAAWASVAPVVTTGSVTGGVGVSGGVVVSGGVTVTGRVVGGGGVVGAGGAASVVGLGVGSVTDAIAPVEDGAEAAEADLDFAFRRQPRTT